MVNVIGKKPEMRGKNCEMISSIWEQAEDRREKDNRSSNLGRTDGGLDQVTTFPE